MKRMQATTIASVLLAAGLVACGNNDEETPAQPTSATIEGAAIKGVVKNAAVDVYELSGSSLDVSRGTRIGTGSTTSSGRFELTVENYNGGAVALVVRGRAANDPAGVTEVECDINLPGEDDCAPGVSFGEFSAVGPEFQLTTCIGSLNRGSRNRFNATAFTELLARRAQSFLAGQTTAAAIRLATSEVNQLTGVNVVTTTPVDITDPAAVAAATPQELTYTALASGILRETNTGADVGDNIDAALDRLSDSFANGSISAANLQTLVDNAQAQLDSVDATDGTGVLQTLAEIASTGEVFDPEPIPTVNDVAVAQAKALVQSIRTEVQSAMNLQAPGEAFGMKLDTILGTDTTSGRLSPQLDSVMLTIATVVDRVSGEFETLQANQSRDLPLVTQNDQNQTQNATLRIQRNAADLVTLTVANQPVRNETVNVTMTFTDPPSGQLPQGNIVGSILGSVETVAATGIRLAMNQGSEALATRAANDAGFDTSETGPVFDNASLNILGTLEEKGVAEPGQFQGRISLAAERCRLASCNDNHRSQQDPNAPLRPWYNPTLILFEGQVSAAGNSVRAAVQFAQTVASAQNFDPGTDFDQDEILECFNEFFCYERPDPNDDPSEQFRNAYSSTNFMDAVVTITAEATFPNTPSALMTLAVDSDGYSDSTDTVLGSATLILNRAGTPRLTLVVSNSAQEPLNPTLTITNASGVIATLRNLTPGGDPVVGEIRVAGVRAGTVSEFSGGGVIVRYDDGTFETMFN